jgi:hydroxyacylglutathione hydrolase
MSGFLLQQFMQVVGPHEANMFLLADPAAHAAVLIDAGALDAGMLETIERRNLRVAAILITHFHNDHIAGLEDYAALWPQARIYAPGAIEGFEVRQVAEGDRVEAGPFEFEVFKTSGHVPEMVSYYCAARGVCFVGDTVFAGSVGGTPDDERFAEQMANLRSKIMTLPPETELCSGHGPMTTVEIEAAGNPFLREGFGRA